MRLLANGKRRRRDISARRRCRRGNGSAVRSFQRFNLRGIDGFQLVFHEKSEILANRKWRHGDIPAKVRHPYFYMMDPERVTLSVCSCSIDINFLPSTVLKLLIFWLDFPTASCRRKLWFFFLQKLPSKSNHVFWAILRDTPFTCTDCTGGLQ